MDQHHVIVQKTIRISPEFWEELTALVDVIPGMTVRAAIEQAFAAWCAAQREETCA